MHSLKPTGRDASVKKYDILSALMVYGLHQDKSTFKLAARLTALITTRYNWRSNELTLGQKEIARIWNVEPRTVKREIAKMRDRQWLSIKRAGARGRVSTYALNLETILTETRNTWDAIGPDFEERAAHLVPEVAVGKVVRVDFGGAKDGAPVEQTSAPWARITADLQAKDSAIFANWYAKLAYIDARDGKLFLASENSFVARYVNTHLANDLLRVARQHMPDVAEIRFVTHRRPIQD